MSRPFEDDEYPEREPPDEDIIGLNIPNDDLIGWREVLGKAGFADDEIDMILRHQNERRKSRRAAIVSIKIEKVDGK